MGFDKSCKTCLAHIVWKRNAVACRTSLILPTFSKTSGGASPSIDTSAIADPPGIDLDALDRENPWLSIVEHRAPDRAGLFRGRDRKGDEAFIIAIRSAGHFLDNDSPMGCKRRRRDDVYVR